MQVFVPSPDFAECARVLDDKRLFKQLVECYQLLLVILDRPKLNGEPRKGWKNHPATVQWRENPGALKQYALTIAEECQRRGMNSAGLQHSIGQLPVPEGENPSWLGDDRVHSSHRARLLQKDFDFYSRYDWPEKSDPHLHDRRYVWAVPSKSGFELVEGPPPKQ